MKKSVVTGLCLALALATLSACTSTGSTGASEEPQATDEAVVEESATESTEETTNTDINEVAESEPTATPVPEPLYWGEENGIEFTAQREFTTPVYNVATDGEDNIIPEIECQNLETTFSITDVSVSEKDDEGYVIYSVSIYSEIPYSAVVPGEREFAWYCGGPCISLMDYYTGTVFPAVDQEGFFDLNETHEQVSSDIAADVDVDGVTYSVKMTKSSEGDIVAGDNNGWTVIGDNLYQWDILVCATDVYSIKSPAEYDGLTMAVDKRGETEYKGSIEGETEAPHVLLTADGEGSISDYYFIKISDLIDEFSQ